MAGAVYRVLPDQGAWIVKREGAAVAESRHDRRTSAVAVAEAICQERVPCRLLVHRENGTVEYEYTFGSLAAAE